MLRRVDRIVSPSLPPPPQAQPLSLSLLFIYLSGGDPFLPPAAPEVGSQDVLGQT